MRRYICLLTILIFSSAFAYSETSYNFTAGWQLFTLPFYTDSASTPCKIVDSPNFTLFGIKGNQYVSCGALDSILPGQAFWVHLPAAEITFTGVPADTSRPYPIALEQGWNLIGNPFLSTIVLGDARIDGVPLPQAEGVSKLVYGYNTAEGNYEAATSLEPWKGYFIFARRAALLELSVPADGGEEPSPAPTVVTIRIEDAPGGAGAEVGSLDLPPGDDVTLWAAGYDANGNYTGDVDVLWMADGSLGTLGATPAPSATYGAEGGGRVGAISASYGALRDSTGRIVVIDESDMAVYPHTADDPVATAENGSEYVADQLILSVRPGTTPERVEEIAAGAGAKIVGRNEAAGLYQLKLSGAPAEAAAALAGAPEVAKTSENYLLELNATPNDPAYGPSAPAAGRWAFEKIKMPLVWNEYTPVADPVIAVLDTGVDASHPELAGRVLAGRNFVDPANPTDTGDVYGHGTPIAGIAAAAGDNSQGMAGVCWNCRVLPVKVCTDTGACPLFSLLNGIIWAVDSGARVVNVSIGADFPPGSGIEPIIRAVTKEAYTRGALVVGAAGNGGHDSETYLPASDRYVLAVGATDEQDQRAGFSNYGVRVDVSAPGAAIYTTSAGGGYATLSGTSESTAFVSGLAGLILSIKNGLNASTLESFITSNADPLATDHPIGGRINAYKALSLLASLNQSPSITSVTPDKWIVAANSAMNIAAAATDPDGDPITYTWTATGGVFGAGAGNIASWKAPASRGTAAIKVTASDPNGNSASAEISIAVLDGAPVELRIAPQSPTLNQGDTQLFTAYAYDAAAISGAAAPVPAPGVKWTLSGGIGAITADGVLAAINAGGGNITAEVDNLAAATQVTVNSTTPPPMFYPTATNAACVNDWLGEDCNLSRTGESTLGFSVPGKWLTVKCLSVGTGGSLYNAPIVDTTDAIPAVYIANGALNGEIYKIKQQDCSTIWGPKQFGVGQYLASPIMVNNPNLVFSPGKRIYVASYSNPAKVVSIDTDGNWKWTYTADSGIVSSIAPVAYASGTVNYIYFGTVAGVGGQLIGLKDDGAAVTVLWKLNIKQSFGVTFDGLLYSSPSLETVNGVDTVFFSTSYAVGASDYLVTALRADTGTPVWTNASNPAFPATGSYFATGGAAASPFTTPVIRDGLYLYVIERGSGATGYMYKLDARDGTFIWKYTFGVRVLSSPAYKNGVLYVGAQDGYVYAIRDDGASASQLWKSAEWFGTPGQAAFSYHNPIIFENGSFLFVASNNGPGEHVKILNIADGTSYQSFPASFTAITGNAMAYESTTGKMEVYVNNSIYMSVLQENEKPQVTNVIFTDSTPPVYSPITSVYPGETFGVTADVLDPDSESSQGCVDNAAVNDIYKYPSFPFAPIEKADKYDVTLDHSAVSGAAATDTFLFNYVPPSLPIPPCDYKNRGNDDAQRSITVALGTPVGDYYLCVTARDRAGETNDTSNPAPALNPACAKLTVVDAPPTIESVTYVPSYVHNTNAATTSVQIVISDPNANIGSLTIDLTALGGGQGIVDITAGCGAFAFNIVSGKWEATCTYDQIKADTTIAPGNVYPEVEACNTVPVCDSDNSTALEVITISSFRVTANPTTEQVPNPVNVTLEAYDKYGNFMNTFVNPTKVDLAELGAADGTTLEWAGAGVTDNGNGTGLIATSTFSAGIAVVTLANIRAEGPIIASASIYTFGVKKVGNTSTTGTNITWTAGALGKFKVTAQNTAPIANQTVDVKIDAYDAYDNFINTYTNTGNPITLSNEIVATGLPSAWATWPLGSVVPSGGMVNGTVTMQIVNPAAEGPIRVFADDTLAGATGDTSGAVFPPNTDITWAMGVIDHFRVEAAPYADLAAGDSSTVTVTAVDANDIPVINYSINSNITHSRIVPGGLSATLEYSGAGITDYGNGTALIAGTAFTSGTATFQVRNITAGEEVRFIVTKQFDTETGNTGTTGTDVNWIPDALDRFEVTAQSTSAIIGNPPVDIIIRALDQYDNFINTYTNAAAVTLSNAYSPPPGAGSPTVTWGGAAVTGSSINIGGFAAGTITVTIDNTVAEGPITAIVTDAGGKTGNTNETTTNITWNYGAADHFDVVAAPFTDLQAGEYATITVTAFDAYNNLILNFNKNVAITHNRIIPGGTSSSLSYTGLSGTTLPGTSFANAVATFSVRDTKAGETIKFNATYLSASGTTDTSGTNVNWIAGDLATLVIQQGACPPSGTAQGSKIMSAGETLDLCAAGFDAYGNLIGATVSEWCVDDGAGWCGGVNNLDSIPAGPTDSNTFSPTTQETKGYIWARAQSNPLITDVTGLIRVGSDTPKAPVLSAAGGENQIVLSWATPTLYVDGLPISQAVKDGMTYNIWFSTTPGIDCTSRPADYSGIGPATTTYTDTSVAPWVRYYYVMTAVNNNAVPPEESACSNEASAVAYEPRWTLITICGDNTTEYLPPSDFNRYHRPMDAVVDGDGYIYVADTDNNRIKKITMDCTFVGYWGRLGNFNGEFKQPSGIALYNDEIYVVDDYDRVQVFSKTGVFKRKWYVQFPIDVEVAPDGTVYVSTEMDSVKKYTSTGAYLGKINITNVKGIAVDATYLYAASVADDTIKVIDTGTGAVVSTFGSSGTDFGEFMYPYDVDVDSSGLIFVADGMGNDRLQILNPDGSINNEIPATCVAPIEECYMDRPLGVGLASTGEIVVLDTYRSRVLIFSPPPP